MASEADSKDRLAQLEEELAEVRAERDAYRIVFDHAPLLIWFKDEKNTVLRANASAAASSGSTSDEVAGRSTYDLYPEEAAGYHADDLEVIRSGVPKLGIIERLDTPGGKRWIQTDKVPWRDASLAIHGVVVFVSDITERVEMQENLYRAQRMESVGVLAGGIAHDFNNLLTGVFGNLDLAANYLDPEHRSHVFLQRASSAIDRCRALTRQLLTFSTGGEPSLRPVALGPLVQEIAAFALSGSAIEPTIDIAEGLSACLGDRDQIAQVFENILVNAAQAMEGHGQLEIRARGRIGPVPGLARDTREFVEVEIQDSGPGVAREDRERIFDPFFTTKSHGTGLGLSSAFFIARKHQGRLDYRSAPDGGAIFRLLLPATSDVPRLDARDPKKLSTDRTEPLLVLDDDPAIRELVSSAGSILSLDVTCASTAAEAVAACREAQESGRPFRVAVLDLTVRGDVGGEEALRQLRALDPGLGAIVASGYSADPVLAEPGEHGFDAVLKKPFRLVDLRAAIDQVLGSRG